MCLPYDRLVIVSMVVYAAGQGSAVALLAILDPAVRPPARTTPGALTVPFCVPAKMMPSVIQVSNWLILHPVISLL